MRDCDVCEAIYIICKFQDLWVLDRANMGTYIVVKMYKN